MTCLYSLSPLSHCDFVYLSIRFYNSCRRLPETKRHSSLFLHWYISKFLVFMAACTTSIHVFLGRLLFLLSSGTHSIINFCILSSGILLTWPYNCSLFFSMMSTMSGTECRSRWSRGLRRGSTAAHLLGLRVRILRVIDFCLLRVLCLAR